MLLYRSLLLIVMFFVVSHLVAQQPAGLDLQHCATDDVRHYLEANIPGMRNREMQINQKIQTYTALHLADSAPQERYFPGGPDFIIPVVVHIVHNGEPVGTGTNIRDRKSVV